MKISLVKRLGWRIFFHFLFSYLIGWNLQYFAISGHTFRFFRWYSLIGWCDGTLQKGCNNWNHRTQSVESGPKRYNLNEAEYLIRKAHTLNIYKISRVHSGFAHTLDSCQYFFNQRGGWDILLNLFIHWQALTAFFFFLSRNSTLYIS